MIEQKGTLIFIDKDVYWHDYEHAPNQTQAILNFLDRHRYAEVYYQDGILFAEAFKTFEELEQLAVPLEDISCEYKKLKKVFSQRSVFTKELDDLVVQFFLEVKASGSAVNFLSSREDFYEETFDDFAKREWEEWLEKGIVSTEEFPTLEDFKKFVKTFDELTITENKGISRRC